MNQFDALMAKIPKIYLALCVLAFEFVLFFLDNHVGPDLPLSLLYALTTLFALRYVDRSFAYLMAVFAALGRTYAFWLFNIDHQVKPSAEIFFSNVTVNLLICYLMDGQLSARARAEAALDDLSKMYQAIIRKADSGIEVFDDRGQCVLANDAAAKILGTTLSHLLQEDLRRFSSWRGTGLVPMADEVLRTGVPRQFEEQIHTKFGKDIWCIATLGQIELKQGNYLLLVFNDISKFKKAVSEMGAARQSAQMALERAGMAERRIISISEETQQRIGQELHDDLGQQLTGIAFMTQVLSQKLMALQLPDEELAAAKITDLVNDAVAKTRRLAHSLYPVELMGYGLREMLGQLSREVSVIFQLECELVFDETCEVDDSNQVIHLYRICQEAISNAVKHGRATKIKLTVAKTSAGIAIMICDNGSGVDLSSLETNSGLGMHTMRYRADMIGASLAMDAVVNGGLCVKIELLQTGRK
ncbi:Sensor histidine kinase LiaS [Ferriphaselus amnicola]|uniref:histidine kinase n=1 Tax=Ferriphaselus amnicola TaxID=1188319 RepID=A0A2Z6G8V0_9PROT|nr:histidine kinase [Ferriphaselus amnicola]BBE49911.1 Sensor histidine kinase LiaS [Ferriphaselus amnicola]